MHTKSLSILTVSYSENKVLPTLTELLIRFLADFDSSFDDYMVKAVQNKSTIQENDEKETDSPKKDDSPKFEKCIHKGLSKDDSEIDISRLPKSKFLYEFLPKLPVMSNGIKLLGVAETNPLLDCGEVYKIRYARPDRPIGHSELFEDCTTIRLTVFGKLISDDLQMTFCRLESASFLPGIQEEDAIGIKAAKNVFELHDACNLTVKPFIRRKTSGKDLSYQRHSLESITMSILRASDDGS